MILFLDNIVKKFLKMFFFFLKRVRQCDILTSQFKQHGIIEELVDRNIFAETLTTTGFNHEFTGQMCGWLWFQRT